MAVVPEGSSLTGGIKVVIVVVSRAYRALSDECNTILSGGPVLEEPVPMDGSALADTRVAQIVDDVGLEAVVLLGGE